LQSFIVTDDKLRSNHGKDNKSDWVAKLAINYSKIHGRSYIRKISHEGPLLVQRSFYPSGPEMAYNYILHPPGGMVGGDRLQIQLHLENDAAAFLTTPSAGKIYRCLSQASRLHIDIVAEENACLYFLPLETIVFDKSYHESSIRLSLASSSQSAFWEIVCLGRTGCDEYFTSGSLTSSCEILLDDSLFYRERTVYLGGDNSLDAPWGLGGFPAYGTLYCYRKNARRDIEDILVEEISADMQSAMTMLDDLIIIRARACSGEKIRNLFTRLIEEIDLRMNGEKTILPRIWKY